MDDRELSYQPYFCEENIWKLCEGGALDRDRSFAVVISNAEGAVPLWSQREAPAPDRPVFWDYHAVAVERDAEGVRVWDFDSELEIPVGFDIWVRESFPAVDRLPRRYSPRFRVVPAQEYLDLFSSDRSHMKDEEGDWREPPPDWPAIYDPDRGMNLDRFVDMQGDFAGEVCTLSELCERFDDGSARA